MKSMNYLIIEFPFAIEEITPEMIEIMSQAKFGRIKLARKTVENEEIIEMAVKKLKTVVFEIDADDMPAEVVRKLSEFKGRLILNYSRGTIPLEHAKALATFQGRLQINVHGGVEAPIIEQFIKNNLPFIIFGEPDVPSVKKRPYYFSDEAFKVMQQARAKFSVDSPNMIKEIVNRSNGELELHFLELRNKSAQYLKNFRGTFLHLILSITVDAKCAAWLSQIKTNLEIRPWTKQGEPILTPEAAKIFATSFQGKVFITDPKSEELMKKYKK